MWALSWSLVWQVPTVWEVTYPTGHQARWRPPALGRGCRTTATKGAVQGLASHWRAGCVGLGQPVAASTRSMTRPKTLGRNLTLRWLVSLGSRVQWALGGSEYPLCADHHSERTKAHRMPTPMPGKHTHSQKLFHKMMGLQQPEALSNKNQGGKSEGVAPKSANPTRQNQVWVSDGPGASSAAGLGERKAWKPVAGPLSSSTGHICIPPDLDNASPLCRRKWVRKMTQPCSSKT